jgi:hypothetical protein
LNHVNLTIKSLFWYKKIGRKIYLILFSASLTATIIEGVSRKPYLLGFIFIDVTIALLGLWLEAALIHLSQLGTIYVETNRRTESHKLIEHQEKNEIYYVSETSGDYIVNITGSTYTKNYKKTETVVEENPDIEMPVIEITTIEKVSKAADNEYSVFAAIDERNKTENIKIILKDKRNDIRKI